MGLGIFKIFSNTARVIDAKASERAEKIASDNAVSFGKQDVEKMNIELGKVNENIGNIKGEIALSEDRIKGIKAEIKKHDRDATELAEVNEDLAMKHCEASERLESQLEPFEIALQTQKEALEEQISAKDELKNAVMQAESDLVTMKAYEDAAKANENLISINTGSGTNAVADFAKRKEEMKKRLIKSRAMKEASGGGDDLAAETKKALGTSGGMSRLEKLKAKKK